MYSHSIQIVYAVFLVPLSVLVISALAAILIVLAFDCLLTVILVRSFFYFF